MAHDQATADTLRITQETLATMRRLVVSMQHLINGTRVNIRHSRDVIAHVNAALQHQQQQAPWRVAVPDSQREATNDDGAVSATRRRSPTA